MHTSTYHPCRDCPRLTRAEVCQWCQKHAAQIAGGAPLAEAAQREKAKAISARKLGRPSKVDTKIAIGMRAAGIPSTRIGEVMGVHKTTVRHAIQETPGAPELIKEIRQKLKVLKMRKAHQVEGKMWARLEKEVDGGEAKDVDAMSRSLHAMEKIQAQVSGEGQKVDLTGVPVNPAIDLKVLIQTLLAE